jgi:uncharacterized protein YifE (UPF0438 family)
MSQPADHAALLARRDFVFPPGEYAQAEREILTKFGRWLEGLATGSILPTTPGQAQFVETARGRHEPETDFERAWRTVLRNRGIGFDVGAAFRALAQARAHRTALEDEYAAARSCVLAKVKAELAEVDEAFASRLAEATEAATTAEQSARDIVLRTGKSVHIAGIRAIYSAPRVSWDTPKLDAYAVQHPEVREFRKLGKPFVNMRFMDKAGTAEEPAPPPMEHSEHSDEPEPL